MTLLRSSALLSFGVGARASLVIVPGILVGPLVVHRPLHGQDWMISHGPSGLAVYSLFATRAAALSCAAELVALAPGFWASEQTSVANCPERPQILDAIRRWLPERYRGSVATA